MRWGEQTELLNAQADAYADLADVLALAARTEDAAEALEQALERYERQGEPRHGRAHA